MQPNHFHDKAMELADEALLLRVKGNKDEAIELFRQAADAERRAAEALPAIPESEPSRSILYRSAASLAYDAKDFVLADRLVASGLAGFAPAEIAKELKDLYEDINFMRHADALGIEITERGMVMTISGHATFYGGALAGQVTGRVDRLQKVFYRTVERLLRKSYRVQAAVDREIRTRYALYLNTQFASSYGVYIQVGAPNLQPSLIPELEIVHPPTGDQVIREVLECLRIVEGATPERLRDRIVDQAYYDDFVGFAKELAPDGEDVKTVALKASNQAVEKPVILRKTRTQIRGSLPSPKDDIGSEANLVTLAGYLKKANSPKKGRYGTVGLDSFDLGGRIVVKVPVGYMKDTVQPYYEEAVVITAFQKGDTYYLEDIMRAPDSTETK